MNTTLIVKLAPTNEQHTLLLATMERFNEACNWIADVAFKHRTAGKYKLQKMLYHEIRDSFGLSAQMTVRAISKVAEAYRRDKRIKPTFNPHGAIVYDQRILSWKGIDRVSLLTLEGRELIPVIMGGYQADRLAAYGKRGQADLIYRDGTFYLAVVVDIPEPPPSEGTGVLGVDMGIANLATDSDGETYSGEQVDAKRRHYERMRAGLQRVGTKSSRRKLKRIRRRERRFKRNVNHTISKRLVAKASDTGRDLAIEDLGGIRERTTVRKAQRSRHSKWAFGELRQFLPTKRRLLVFVSMSSILEIPLALARSAATAISGTDPIRRPSDVRPVATLVMRMSSRLQTLRPGLPSVSLWSRTKRLLRRQGQAHAL